MHMSFDHFRQQKIQDDAAWGYAGREADLLKEYDKYLASVGVEEGAEQALDRELEAVTAIVLTTETAPDIKISKRLEIITAECVFGMNVFKDFFAGVTDFFGGRSRSSQTVLRDARRTVLRELKLEAARLGANAVVGVDLDYSEISGKGMSMLFLVASGTAVIAELEQ